MPITPEMLQQAYLESCEAELQAFKPGNVSIHSEGHGMTVAEFRLSAKASAPHLCDPALSLGEKIFQAIASTREAVGCNTNLGIVLLAAPMMEACLNGAKGTALRENLRHVLDHTTREDADWVYRAIRVASPGGLGESAEEDVRSTPTVTLLEAMKIAADRDRIAWQYTNYYTNVFDLAIPSYHSGLSLWGDEQWATVAVFTGLLLAFPDSHIERKFGARFTRMVADRMTLVEQALTVTGSPGQAMRVLRKVDAEFKSAGINPGTTADLTVACILAVRLDRLLKAS
ncbi:MAG: triphosphoribosyl-dephospho-CoA synthase [Proteobacteria bacterium]|nr:triphosphoribosyl-dephospho-CoA synthase [Pseudomonadota bacterium]